MIVGADVTAHEEVAPAAEPAVTAAVALDDPSNCSQYFILRNLDTLELTFA